MADGTRLGDTTVSVARMVGIIAAIIVPIIAGTWGVAYWVARQERGWSLANMVVWCLKAERANKGWICINPRIEIEPPRPNP